MDALVEEIKKLDNELYRLRYHAKDYKKHEELWDSIKGNRKLLEVASRVVKNKFGEKDTFLATAIVECMLIDYEIYENGNPDQLNFFNETCVDMSLYQELVNKIYTNNDLARIVLDGYSNGGYSFLLYTLFNDNLDLTDEQKTFALEEAMHKVGTKKHSKQMDDYEQQLEEKGITDDLTVIAPEIGPIGAKTWNRYMAGMFASMNTNQAHGKGEFDIRYHILKNHNFADKMPQLVYDFFVDDENYDFIVDYWEWDIVNLCRREEDDEPIIYVDEILFISNAEIYARLPHEQVNKIISEINFIKRLHEIRPAGCRHLGEYDEEETLAVPIQKTLI
ncbi:MAG: hypothetical protein PHG03_05325 [Bacilli bacterium]|nr:hypothetical protein [Bacilli bacterium]MDD4795956.1 hypothetical protein [Bacilli bacterium]